MANEQSFYEFNHTNVANPCRQERDNSHNKSNNSCFDATVVEINNIASDMYKQNQYDRAMDMLNKAFSYISQYDKEIERVATEIQNTKEPKFLGSSSFTKQIDKLDMYDWPGAPCDYGTRYLHEIIRLDAAFSPKLQNENEVLACLVVIPYNLGLVHLMHGSLSVPLKLFELALKQVTSEVRCKLKGSSNVLIAILNNIGCILYNKGLLDKALENFQEAFDLGNKMISINKSSKSDIDNDLGFHTLLKNVSTITSNMGRTYFALNDHKEALTQCVETLRIRRLTLENKHIDALVAMYNLGIVYHKMGRFDEALKNYNAFVAYITKHVGECKRTFSKDIISALTNILLIHCEQNMYEDQSFRIAKALKNLRTIRSHYADDNHCILQHLSIVGDLLVEVEEYEFGLSFFQEQHQIERALLGDKNPELAITINKIGETFQKQNNSQAALKCYHQALKLQPSQLDAKIFVSNRSIFAIINYNIGIIYCNEGMENYGIKRFELAVEIQKSALGECHPDVAMMLYNVGIKYFELNRVLKAMESLMESLLIRQLLFGNAHVLTAESLFCVACIHHKKGEVDEALSLYNEILHIHKSMNSSNTDTVIVLQNIAQIYHEKEEFEKSMDVYTEALSISLNISVKNRLHSAYILSRIGNLFADMGYFYEARQAFATSYAMEQEISLDLEIDINIGHELLEDIDFFNNEHMIDFTIAAAAA